MEKIRSSRRGNITGAAAASNASIDLSETVLAGSHQPMSHWITTLYLLNLNVSMARIALELALSEDVVQTMGATIQEGIAKKTSCGT